MEEMAKETGVQRRIVNVSSSIHTWFSGDMFDYHNLITKTNRTREREIRILPQPPDLLKVSNPKLLSLLAAGAVSAKFPTGDVSADHRCCWSLTSSTSSSAGARPLLLL
ncbi:hypothetical protein V2J09_016934 [Rumex salicifolius]